MARQKSQLCPPLLDLTQIEQNGYGDCIDLSVLMTAILREAGVQARSAMVERRLYYAPPNHVNVQAKIAGKIKWLDLT
ncbi:transglutaminase domain-containing protein [Sodalis-like endosymbiont of Proechinophthirus fluctus]|uniref:transglutaminase domain-containing protein n=1 Tax=Sodalis-like endosymbiont of Proechinophthirus fluctus TaxID=1462730 RepID=UPI00093B5132|nr:transglutaminase domain-containing protein [Sodalis-like endosymbiont of Proechinophthirus fluctus]